LLPVASFPTRRSSDLLEGGGHAAEVDANAAVVLVADDDEGIDRRAVGEEENGPRPSDAAGAAGADLALDALGAAFDGSITGGEIDRKSTRLNSSHSQI